MGRRRRFGGRRRRKRGRGLPYVYKIEFILKKVLMQEKELFQKF